VIRAQKGRRVARGGAAAGARDQEPAHAHPALRERLRRHFSTASPQAKALVDECSETIIGEVESLKGLVDEFSQFARMPSPRTVPTDLAQLITDTIALYNGIFTDVRIEQRFAPGVPLVMLDPEQVRRVIINLVDNAIEAMERPRADRGPNRSSIRRTASSRDRRRQRPGHSASEREKLFLPYYSTKRRGSGLGLAIVRRIIAEHGGQHRRRRQTRRTGLGLLSSYLVEEIRHERHESTKKTGFRVFVFSCVSWLTTVKPTILIVDDEPGVRTALSGVLRDEGYSVESVPKR